MINWNVTEEMKHTTSALILLSLALSPNAFASVFESEGFKLFADFRFRLEADWDSSRADGSERSDRNRARIRARVGMEYTANDTFSLGIRLRTGSELSQQSPHITLLDFDDNDTGDADAMLDKYFVKARWPTGWAWAGRNGLPMWKQNELLWDDDVTVTGVGLGTRTTAGEGSLAINLGYFSLPVGMKSFSGDMAMGQLVWNQPVAETAMTFAAGVLALSADPDDPDAPLLLRGNGARDYLIFTGSAKLAFASWSVGLDYMSNHENYSESEPLRDETAGYVITLSHGKTKETGDWMARATWAHIEALAVSSSYSQDDWVRWGSATQTRSSDFEGLELRFDYKLRKGLTLVNRLYLIESITTSEDGNRFRIDLNWSF